MSELFGLKLDNTPPPPKLPQITPPQLPQLPQITPPQLPQITCHILPLIHTRYSLETGNILKRLQASHCSDSFDKVYNSSASEFDVLYEQEKRLIEGVVKNMSENVNNIFPGVGIPKINQNQTDISLQLHTTVKIPNYEISPTYVEEILLRIVKFGYLFNAEKFNAEKFELIEFHIQILNKEMKKVGRILETITLLKRDVIADTESEKPIIIDDLLGIKQVKELYNKWNNGIPLPKKTKRDDFKNKLLTKINENIQEYNLNEQARVDEIVKENTAESKENTAESKENTFTFDPYEMNDLNNVYLNTDNMLTNYKKDNKKKESWKLVDNAVHALNSTYMAMDALYHKIREAAINMEDLTKPLESVDNLKENKYKLYQAKIASDITRANKILYRIGVLNFLQKDFEENKKDVNVKHMKILCERVTNILNPEFSWNKRDFESVMTNLGIKIKIKSVKAPKKRLPKEILSHEIKILGTVFVKKIYKYLHENENEYVKKRGYKKVTFMFKNVCFKEKMKRLIDFLLEYNRPKNRKFPTEYNLLHSDLEIGDKLFFGDAEKTIVDIQHSSNKRFFLCKDDDKEVLDFFLESPVFEEDGEEGEENKDGDEWKKTTTDKKYNLSHYISEDKISFAGSRKSRKRSMTDDNSFREKHFIQIYQILENFVCLFYKNNILEDFTMKSRGIEPNTCLKSERILHNAHNEPFTNFRLQPNDFWLELSNSICFKTNTKPLHALILSTIDELKEEDPRLEDIIAFEKKIFEQARTPLYCCQYDLSQDIDDKLLTKYIISDTRTLYARMFFNNGFKSTDINLSLKKKGDTIRSEQRKEIRKKDDEWKTITFELFLQFKTGISPDTNPKTTQRHNLKATRKIVDFFNLLNDLDSREKIVNITINNFTSDIGGDTLMHQRTASGFNTIKAQFSKYRLRNWPLHLSMRKFIDDKLYSDLFYGENTCQTDIPKYSQIEINKSRKHLRPFLMLNYGYDIRKHELRDIPMDIILNSQFEQQEIKGIGDDVEKVWVNKELNDKKREDIDQDLPIVAIASIIRSNRKVDYHTLNFEGRNALGQCEKGFLTIVIVRKRELFYYIQKYKSPHTYFVILPERKITKAQNKQLNVLKGEFIKESGLETYKDLCFEDIKTKYEKDNVGYSENFKKWAEYKKLIEKHAYSAGDSKHYCFAYGQKLCGQVECDYLVVMDDQIETFSHQICDTKSRHILPLYSKPYLIQDENEERKTSELISKFLNYKSIEKINSHVRDIKDHRGFSIFKKFENLPITHSTAFKYLIQILKGLKLHFLGMKSRGQNQPTRLWAKPSTNCVWLFNVKRLKKQMDEKEGGNIAQNFFKGNPILCNLDAAEDMFMHVILELFQTSRKSLNTVHWKKTVGTVKTGTAGRSSTPDPFLPLWKFAPLIDYYKEQDGMFQTEFYEGKYKFADEVNLTEYLAYSKKKTVPYVEYDDENDKMI